MGFLISSLSLVVINCVFFSGLAFLRTPTGLNPHARRPVGRLCGAENVDSSGSSPFEEKLNRLRFGFEERRPVQNETRSHVVPTLPMRGLRSGAPPGLDEIGYEDADSDISYVRLRCAKGHVWKATPGSFVCDHCPDCAKRKRALSSQGSGRKRGYRGSVERQLVAYILRQGGSLVNPSSQLSGAGSSRLMWNSRVTVECSEGHTWSATCSNLVNYKSWCPKCLSVRRRLSTDDLHATAKFFGGAFLGFADDHGEQGREGGGGGRGEGAGADRQLSLGHRKARWCCSNGHIFTRRANHIRRKKMNAQGEPSSRKCAWCNVCVKQGKYFEWAPT